MQLLQGVDIVDITKFQSVCEKNSDFVKDIFTGSEQEYCFSKMKPYVHFAGRFAAKEAFLKALGRGVSGPGANHIFQEIEITRTGGGRPSISLKGWASALTRKKNINQHTVSISHSGQYAVSTVILVGGKDRGSRPETGNMAQED